MPYIPPANRPPIDKAVDALAGEIAGRLAQSGQTAEISELYRAAFMEVAGFIAKLEKTPAAPAATRAQELARTLVEVAKSYNQRGGWLGELNYAVTTLIQAVPFKLHKEGRWAEAMRYWLYAETVGALVRASYEVHAAFGNDWIGNGLAGVFEDVKDEYKRRVNTAYEAAQILKSGDCYEMTSFHTQLVPFEKDGVKGYIEIMLPKQDPKPLRGGKAGA